MQWTKTDTGYACGAYAIERTPGRRWIVRHDGEQLGAQVATLDAAKARANVYVPATAPTPPADPPKVDVLGYPVGQVALTPADWGIETPLPPIPAPPLPEIPPADPFTATPELPPIPPAPAEPIPEIDERIDGAFVLPVRLSEPYRPVPRESLTDQFTRLVMYRDVGATLFRRAYAPDAPRRKSA